MTAQPQYDPQRREEVLTELRREILAARLKVSLDKRRGRKTSEAVKFLSEMELPPISDLPGNQGSSEWKVVDSNRTGTRTGRLGEVFLSAKGSGRGFKIKSPRSGSRSVNLKHY